MDFPLYAFKSYIFPFGYLSNNLFADKRSESAHTRNSILNSLISHCPYDKIMLNESGSVW